MAAPVINTPAHLEHRIKTPDGRTLAVAEWGDPDSLPVIAMHGTPWRSHDRLADADPSGPTEARAVGRQIDRQERRSSGHWR